MFIMLKASEMDPVWRCMREQWDKMGLHLRTGFIVPPTIGPWQGWQLVCLTDGVYILLQISSMQWMSSLMSPQVFECWSGESF